MAKAIKTKSFRLTEYDVENIQKIKTLLRNKGINPTANDTDVIRFALVLVLIQNKIEC